jgi:hypothetical protein
MGRKTLILLTILNLFFCMKFLIVPSWEYYSDLREKVSELKSEYEDVKLKNKLKQQIINDIREYTKKLRNIEMFDLFYTPFKIISSETLNSNSSCAGKICFSSYTKRGELEGEFIDLLALFKFIGESKYYFDPKKLSIKKI